jgi:hypothetical protein
MTSKSVADRRQERVKTLAGLEANKAKHKYLVDAAALLAKPSKAVEEAEPGIGFKAADERDAVANRKKAVAGIPMFLVEIRQHAMLGLHGHEALRAAHHYLLDGDTDPNSFAAKEAALKYLVGALTGGSEKWEKDAKAKAEGLLHDLAGSTLERTAAGAETGKAREAYKAAATEWDDAYEAAKGLVTAAAHLTRDAKLYDAIIWTHPRHVATPAPNPVPSA